MRHPSSFGNTSPTPEGNWYWRPRSSLWRGEYGGACSICQVCVSLTAGGGLYAPVCQHVCFCVRQDEASVSSRVRMIDAFRWFFFFFSFFSPISNHSATSAGHKWCCQCWIEKIRPILMNQYFYSHFSDSSLSYRLEMWVWICKVCFVLYLCCVRGVGGGCKASIKWNL